MPRFVRNFWATISTPEHEVATGPRTSDGDIRIDIKIRNEGAVDSGIIVRGYIDGDELVLTVDGTEVKRVNRDAPKLHEKNEWVIIQKHGEEYTEYKRLDSSNKLRRSLIQLKKKLGDLADVIVFDSDTKQSAEEVLVRLLSEVA